MRAAAYKVLSIALPHTTCSALRCPCLQNAMCRPKKHS